MTTRHSRALGAALAAALAAVTLSACSPSPASAGGRIVAVGAENEYADVLSQIGGRFVSVSAVMSNPNADPHTFESNTEVAQLVSSAALVVQNGAGYDDFMTRIEQASPSSSRKVIVVQALLGLGSATPNPHLWYAPTTMPKVAAAVAADLGRLEPAHKAYFQANLRRFDRSLRPWLSEIATIKAKYPGAKVATTEPVADYLIQAAGLVNATPFPFQADVMNGVDPAPQDVSLEQSLLARREVRVFVYNKQVTDSLTQSLLAIAGRHHVPVVGVYETMPRPGYDYQSWMLAEAKALLDALEHGRSAPSL